MKRIKGMLCAFALAVMSVSVFGQEKQFLKNYDWNNFETVFTNPNDGNKVYYSINIHAIIKN